MEFLILSCSDNGSLISRKCQQQIWAYIILLTSVHVNSRDQLFLASGYSRNVALYLYDINSGRRLQVYTDMHREHINVVKFANYSPSLFAVLLASSSRGNVMVCFSPDDHYLLVSAVDKTNNVFHDQKKIKNKMITTNN